MLYKLNVQRMKFSHSKIMPTVRGSKSSENEVFSFKNNAYEALSSDEDFSFKNNVYEALKFRERSFLVQK